MVIGICRKPPTRRTLPRVPVFPPMLRVGALVGGSLELNAICSRPRSLSCIWRPPRSLLFPASNPRSSTSHHLERRASCIHRGRCISQSPRAKERKQNLHNRQGQLEANRLFPVARWLVSSSRSSCPPTTNCLPVDVRGSPVQTP